MDIKNKIKEPLIFIENINKCPSCELPSSTVYISESPIPLEKKSVSKKNIKRKKKVTFSEKDNIRNIPDQKKKVNKKVIKQNKTIFDNQNIEDNKEERCVNCITF